MNWTVEWVPGEADTKNGTIVFVFGDERFECQGSAKDAHKLSIMLRDFKTETEETVISGIERSFIGTVKHLRALR